MNVTSCPASAKPLASQARGSISPREPSVKNEMRTEPPPNSARKAYSRAETGDKAFEWRFQSSSGIPDIGQSNVVDAADLGMLARGVWRRAAMSRGIVYCAQGERHFLEALASAKSSLQHNAVPHVIFSDRELGGPIPGIDVRTQHGCGLPFADKIDAMTRSPFAQTIYLDTDTFVAAEITELFELLERFDIAAAHAPAYLGFD